MKVLFTGISGVGLRESVQKLRDFVANAPGFLRNVHPVLKAERHFLAVIEETGFLPASTAHTSAATRMIRALGLPRPLIRRCWSQAFRQLLDVETPSASADVFMCCHTVFFHQATWEFFSPIDTALLRAWKPEVVVTLLDDVENCLDRLKSEHQMFSGATYAYSGVEGFTNALNHMRLLCDWRASEVMAAERLAADLGVPHYCLAVKHPVQTFASLIYQRARPVLYLSHPISEPRRRLAAGDTEGFDNFVSMLGEACVRLRRGATLIEPTTIDEFRLRSFRMPPRTENEPSLKVYLPHHTPRWPFEQDALWCRPKQIEQHPLDPGGHFSEQALAEFEQAKAQREAAQLAGALVPLEIAANLLGVLVGNIKAQIDARDHKLVEQSAGLIVLRPVYKGNSSSGVEAEVHYHCQMCLSEQDRAGGLWIYTHREDEFAWLLRWAETELKWRLHRGEVRGQGSREQNERAIEEATGSVDYADDRAQVAQALFAALTAREIRLLGSANDGPLGPRPEVASAEAWDGFAAQLATAQPPYREIVQSYRQRGELSVTILDGPGYSLDDFVTRVIESCGHAR